MKKIVVNILRALGILGLCAAIVMTWNALEHRAVSGPAEVIFPGTQNDADCAILLSGGSCVVIDTGEAVDAEQIWKTLESRNVQRIDCLILSHPDQDHLGGAAFLVEKLPVTQVIVPYFAGEKDLYDALVRQLDEKNIPVYAMSRDRLFTYGDLDLRIYPPQEYFYDKSNNYSLAVLATHGDVQMFFAGDAEYKRLGELLKMELPEQVDLYKTAYHGRDTGERCLEIIDRLQPKMAVISALAAEDNIAQAFARNRTHTYSTVGKTVSFLSDGKTLTYQPD